MKLNHLNLTVTDTRSYQVLQEYFGLQDMEEQNIAFLQDE